MIKEIILKYFNRSILKMRIRMKICIMIRFIDLETIILKVKNSCKIMDMMKI